VVEGHHIVEMEEGEEEAGGIEAEEAIVEVEVVGEDEAAHETVELLISPAGASHHL
jgi:hypothetical protein